MMFHKSFFSVTPEAFETVDINLSARKAGLMINS